MTRTDRIRERHVLVQAADRELRRQGRRRESMRGRRHRYEASHRAQGLCKSCSEPAVVGGRCAYHREQNNAARRRGGEHVHA